MIRRKLHKLWHSLRARGPVRTIRAALAKYRYERRLQIDTDFYFAPGELGVNQSVSRHAVAYTPSSYLALDEAFVSGSIDCRGQVLVDYGCGMGRAVLVAATQPFKRIIGIEASPYLADCARANLARYAAGARVPVPDWEIVTVDARDYEPPSDATVFYFYDPFDEIVLRSVLVKIAGSLQRHSRACTLIYLAPRHRNLLLEAGWRCIRSPDDGPAVFVIGK